MTLTGLAIRNLTRNKFRVALTMAGVSIAIVAFLLLRTVIWAWSSGGAFAAKDRVVTRHKVTFVMSLPKRYVNQVKSAPHVTQTTWANWFGAKDPKHDSEFFQSLAVDSDTYFQVYNELAVPPDQMSTFLHDKQGAIVGDVLARKLGWKVGDRVPLESGIYPGDWELHIDGIYAATARSVDRSTVLFHWDYMNDALPESRRDNVGWIVSRVDDPARAADVGVALDKLFDTAETPTLSQDEHSFATSFMGMFVSILRAMNIVSAVILVIMTLILGNT
ncbi:MAG: ABC transporter permease, partial [Polyangiaceae bacterium]